MSIKYKSSIDVDGYLNTGEYGVYAGHIKLDTTPTNIPTGIGTMYWDSANRTYSLIDGDGDTTLQIGQEQRVLVHNNTGSTLTDGQIVYVSGSTGELPSVTLASAGDESTSAATLGMVTETIVHGSDGFITTSGIVHGLNTLAFNEGDQLWLGTTAGTFTSTKPISPNHLVLIGYVIKKSGGNGSVFVKIQNTQELDESSDVLFTSLAGNDILAYEGAPVNLWKNKTISGVLGYTPANASGISNYITKFTGVTTLGNSSIYDSGITVETSLSLLSPIFYDYNNTGYYLDPSGISNLNYVYLSGFTASGNALIFGDTYSNSFIKNGGISSQFLKADGSVDSNTYALASSLSSYVPTSRTITINGTSYDLSANRSWTTVSSVTGTGGYGGLTLSGTVTSSGNITLGGTPTGTWPISVSGSANTATYASNSSKLYSTDAAYAYGSANPYYGYLTYNSSANRWRFKVSPATPDSVEVAYADTSGTVSGITVNTGLIRDRLAASSTIDGLTTANFRTTLFGSTTSGYQISTSRWNSVPSPLTGLNAYSTMLAWAGLDTHGFLAVDYSTGGAIIGGGSADTINWRKRVLIEDTWTNSKYFSSGGEIYGTIFYDANDSGYYSDLASTSQSATRQRGGTLYGPNTTWGAYLLVGGNGRTSYIDNTLTASVCATDGNIHLDAASGKTMYLNWYDGGAIIFGNGAESQIGFMSSSGDFTANSSSRSPIFYDSNDTAYYLNPASSSNLNSVTASMVTSKLTALYGTSTVLGQVQTTSTLNFGIAAGSYGYGISTNNAGGLDIMANQSGQPIRFWSGTANESPTKSADFNGTTVNFYGSTYAPILYDSNNTGYYVDPSSTSNTNVMLAYQYQGNGNVGGTGNAAWFPSGMYSGSTQWLYGHMYRNTANTYGGGEAQYTIMYDTNDTSYYCDPASTSRTNVIISNNIGVVRSGGSNDPYGALSVSAPSGDNYAYIGLTRNGVVGMAMGIDTSSNFWIGTSGGGYNAVRTGTYITISTGGTLTATGDIIAYSDSRVKENVSTIENAIEKVIKLRGVTYNRIDKEDKSQKIGVIAQEIKKVLPQVVQEQEDGMLGVSYGNITAVLIEAIKEQQTQIEELKQLVNQLIKK